MVFKSTWLAPYTGSVHVIFGRTIAFKEMIFTCLYPSFLRDLKMYTHLFASRSFPLTWDENLQSFCNVTPNRVKLSLCSMPHSRGKSGVTPFLAIQSSLHLLVLQLIPLTSVHSKNAFSAFCDSSTLFLRTVTRIEVSSAYLVRSLSWQYRATSRSFKNRLNKLRAADASPSSTAVDILPITNSILTDPSLCSDRQEADVPVDNVWV